MGPEAPDYLEHIENLRGIGCPEETIRYIIFADVNNLYKAKRREVSSEMENTLKGMLSKEEFQNYLLPMSNTAITMRTKLAMRVARQPPNGRRLTLHPDAGNSAGNRVRHPASHRQRGLGKAQQTAKHLLAGIYPPHPKRPKIPENPE